MKTVVGWEITFITTTACHRIHGVVTDVTVDNEVAAVHTNLIIKHIAGITISTSDITCSTGAVDTVSHCYIAGRAG